MRANDLLLWLSARREGSWQQFREAVEQLDTGNGEDPTSQMNAEGDSEFPLHQQLRLDFERLAHVEFFACGCEDGWRVVPPTLAAQPINDGVRAVLCGARSPALRERVLHAASNLACDSRNPAGVPTVFRFVASDTEALSKLAEQTGVHFQPDAPLAILSHVPPCDSPSQRRTQSEFPVGADWSIHEFDTSERAWRMTDYRHAQAARTGVFRFMHRFQRPTYFLRWAGGTFKLPRAVALYILLRRGRRDVLSYNTSTQALSLPAIYRPPQLLERALVLCSGMPPSYYAATASLTYADVPMEVAHLAAELLRQPLR